MSDEVRRLRRRGVTTDDIAAAQTHQDAQRRVGSRVQSLGEIVGLDPAGGKSGQPTPLQPRQLRGKDAGAQASTLTRQLALTAKSITAATELRLAANIIDRHHGKIEQSEFDFMAGNVSVGFQYHTAMRQRLLECGATTAQRNQAASVLWVLTQHIKFQSYEVDTTPAQVAELTGIQQASLSRTFALLERIGAIKRNRVGRSDSILITPEGVYRGNFANHSMTVRKYKLNVVDGGKSKPSGQVEMEA